MFRIQGSVSLVRYQVILYSMGINYYLKLSNMYSRKHDFLLDCLIVFYLSSHFNLFSVLT